MKPYVRPTPRPCSACGALVVHEFGTFDAASYKEGVLNKHFCSIEVPAPINEREWNALQNERPAPTPPPAAQPRKVEPQRKERPMRGGVE